ncbi:MAG TPA: hypothetical protein VFX03_02610 [Thermomicrobiales bacterium]|nr:hypothetical protein [Thermomicrobiales bacterium]
MPTNKDEPKRMPPEERDAPPRPAPKDKPADDVDDDAFAEAKSHWADDLEKMADESGARVDYEDAKKLLPEGVHPRREVTPQKESNTAKATGGEAPHVEAVNPDPYPAMQFSGEKAVGSPMDVQAFLDSVPGLREFLASNALAAVESVEKQKSATPAYIPLKSAAAWQPKKFLVHYRNDVQPKKRIVRRSVNKATGRLYDDPSAKGETIEFINGHFFATEQWQVDQLEWMRDHPLFDANGGVIGGDPAIWVDEGDDDVLYCPECNNPFASAKKLMAHRKATHHVAA